MNTKCEAAVASCLHDAGQNDCKLQNISSEVDIFVSQVVCRIADLLGNIYRDILYIWNNLAAKTGTTLEQAMQVAVQLLTANMCISGVVIASVRQNQLLWGIDLQVFPHST